MLNKQAHGSEIPLRAQDGCPVRFGRFLVCRVTVLALLCAFPFHAFRFAVFSRHTVSEIMFSVSRAALSYKMFVRNRAAKSPDDRGQGDRETKTTYSQIGSGWRNPPTSCKHTLEHKLRKQEYLNKTTETIGASKEYERRTAIEATSALNLSLRLLSDACAC